MNSQGPSTRFAIAASFTALAVFMWGCFLDWHFVIGEWGFLMGQFGLAALIYTAIICGWIWALVAAKAGSHRATYALLAYSVLLCAYALQDLLVYCPSTCPKIWLYYFANWGNLTCGLVSVVAVVLKMRRSSAS